jgi:outer membrane protein
MIILKIRKMKKLTLLGLSLLLTSASFAQTKEADKEIKSNSLFVTGLANYKYQKINATNQKDNTFEFATSAGYFVSNNVLFGAVAGYSSSVRKIDNVKVSDNNIYSAGVFARYFYTPHKQYSFFNELSVVYAHGETTSYDPATQTVSVDGIVGEISLGFIYWISKRFGLQAAYAGLAYTSASFDEFDNSAAQGFTIGGDLTNLKIGAVVKL